MDENKTAGSSSKREQFGSKFGMVMTMIGAAVGLGNLWRFPYMTGMFGGGAFVLIYLITIILVGAPIMMVEWAAARHWRRGPLGVFKASGIKGGTFMGWLNIGGLVMSLSVYSVVIAWALYSAILAITGGYKDANAGDVFNGMLGKFWPIFICTAVVVILCGVTLAFGIQKGLERVSKYCIPFLFVIMIVLIIRSLMLPGAIDGLIFYLKPDFSHVDGSVFLGAMGQAFFSLCLGGTFMVILGSYMPDSTDLRKTAAETIIGDTLAGLMAGFTILPAAYAFNMELSSGPPLTFITLPEIFKLIPGGMFFCFLFFLLVFLAAYLSDASGYEVIIGTMVDEFKMNRKKVIVVFCIIQLLLAIPAIKSLDYLLAVDQLFGSALQPICSMLVLIAYIWVLPKLEALKGLNKGAEKTIFPDWLYYWTKFGVPVIIIILFVMGFKDFIAMIMPS